MLVKVEETNENNLPQAGKRRKAIGTNCSTVKVCKREKQETR